MYHVVESRTPATIFVTSITKTTSFDSIIEVNKHFDLCHYSVHISTSLWQVRPYMISFLVRLACSLPCVLKYWINSSSSLHASYTCKQKISFHSTRKVPYIYLSQNVRIEDTIQIYRMSVKNIYLCQVPFTNPRTCHH